MNEIKIGDVVKLKSGGPDMTVSCVEKDGDLGCLWFDDGSFDSDPNYGSFPPATLVKTKPLDT